MKRDVSRRQLLASIGGLGGLGAAGMVVAADDGPTYTHYTYAREATGGARLRVAWWATHNGQVITTQGDGDEATASTATDPDESPSYVDDAEGPVLEAENVLPGDEGKIAMGLEAEVPEEDELQVWYNAELVSASENGVNEPERSAGDDPLPEDDEGELPEYTDVTVWEDQGLVGGCDGDLSLWESRIERGSLESTFQALEEGQSLGCFSDGDGACLGLGWELAPDDPDINVVQGDSATFRLSFRATSDCDDDNPFAGGETDD